MDEAAFRNTSLKQLMNGNLKMWIDFIFNFLCVSPEIIDHIHVWQHLKKLVKTYIQKLAKNAIISSKSL